MIRNPFKMSMISAALGAQEILGSSPLASKLKAHGFTPATMAAEAKELTELYTQVQSAKGALVQASAALANRAKEFATKWASYSNLVRGMTTDEALRAAHGVGSPGVNKHPRFHRARRTTAPSADGGTPTTPTTSTTPNGHV